MRIAIVGGSCDPFHLGHLALARGVGIYFDEVWIQPCYNHMFGKKLTPALYRLRMAELGIQVSMKRATGGRLKVSCFEICLQHEGSTYEMLKKVKEQYPQDQFAFVIGQDNADVIEKWQNYEALLNEFQMVVVARKGYESKSQDAWYKKSPHLFLNLDLPDITSTNIREAIKAAKKIEPAKFQKTLPLGVIKYIERFKLYGATTCQA